MTRTLAVLALLLALSGCKTHALGPEWSPLSKVVERQPQSIPLVRATTVFTKGSHVYVASLDKFLANKPPGSPRYEALLAHEREHARRQFAYLGMPGEAAVLAWITHYGANPAFMWSEEQHGWYHEIVRLRDAGLWGTAKTASVALTMSKRYKTLLGQPMVSFEDAARWIRDVLLGRWEPGG